MPNTVTNSWTATQTTAQYRAVAWLRWRIFLNQFRRKGGVGELVARILILPFAAAVLIGPTIAAGFFAWLFASEGHFDHIAWLLWAAFAFCQFLNIQLGQPGTTFDPTQLIRFPLAARNYIAIRLFFGLLAPANISATLIAFFVALGISIAIPSLSLYAFIALAVFAAANVLFSRMIFAWVDRWLATRRAREVFTGLIFTFSLGLQWLNFTFNPAYHRHGRHAANSFTPQKLNAAASFYHRVLPWIAGLPPNLTSSALVSAQHGKVLAFLAETLACALYAAAFFAIFAGRTSTEYRGENLSDQANAVPVKRTKLAPVKTAVPLSSGLALAPAARVSANSAVAAIVGKEFLSMRRNIGIFYGLIAPLFILFLFVFKMASGFHASWFFPAALAYAMMGLAPLAYNAFGLEGAGVQFYFMAPIRFKDVFLAKNIVNFSIALVEITAVYALISAVSGIPPWRMTVAGLLWVVGTLLLSMVMGNRRSITAPKKIEPGRSASKQASPLSALISFGLLIVSAGFGASLFLLEMYFDTTWILLPTLALYAVAGIIAYRASLETMDAFAKDHREEMFAELCKS